MTAKNNQLVFEAISIKGNTGYASGYLKNGLYRINLNSGESFFLRNFDEPMTMARIHSTALRIKNKVFFIPYAGDNISVLDTDNLSIMKIPIPPASRDEYPFYRRLTKFIDATQHGNDLWLIPSTYPGIIRLDLTSYELEVIDDWMPQGGFVVRAKPIIEGNSVLFPNGKNNYVFKFNMNNRSMQLYTVGKHNNGVSVFRKVGAAYLLAPRLPGSIVAWNPSLDAAIEYENYPESFESGDFVFADVYSYGKKVVFVPFRANMGLVLEDERLIPDDTVWKKKENSTVYRLFETGIATYYREVAKDYVRYFKISKSDNSMSDYEFYVVNNEQERDTSLDNARLRKDVLYDNGIYGLQDFLDTISRKDEEA